jgi:dihydroxyacetone kinase
LTHDDDDMTGVTMQRFINNPDEVVEDTVKGFVKAHSDLVRLAENPRVIVSRHAPVSGKVGVVTGGGSGHEPAFIGYTGRNMLDAWRWAKCFHRQRPKASTTPCAKQTAARAWSAFTATMPATT